MADTLHHPAELPPSGLETITVAPGAARTHVTQPGTDDASHDRLALVEGYEDLRLLGSGSFGEVRLVRDRRLDRTVAMKVLRPDVISPSLRARFLAEIKLTAGLDHPGIVPVYDFGELPDGRLWFTMAEVRGRTLRAILDEVAPGSATVVSRRRFLDIFARVCDAVAYAHSRGVIHRDLKPENVMVGDFGRVLVMDWGIARRLDAGPETTDGFPSPDRPPLSIDGLTQHGEVLGTPAYMAPEQARGEVARHGPATDVYALGAILYHVLAGRPPYSGVGFEGWRKVLEGNTAPLSTFGAPPELVSICEKAMARDPAHRHPHAGVLAADVEAFLAGAQRRDRALAELGKAAARLPEIARLDALAEARRVEAKQLLAHVRPFDPVDAKLPGWELEDDHQGLVRQVALEETRWMEEVHGALAIDPDLKEAHLLLADHYRDRLAAAELSHRLEDAARFEVLLRAHDRGRHTAFLSGMGALTLMTDPPGATVSLYRYTTRLRRQVPELVEEIGPTPIVEKALARGSYLLRISAPGRVEVAYPVLIERGETWSGVRPGESDPHPVYLPRFGEIGEDEVYVPAGFCWTGGDPAAMDGLPARRVWIDGFAIARFPVTNAEYLAFLDDLVAQGREEEALAACPRVRRGLAEAGELLYGRDEQGRFVLVDGVAGRQEQPSFPVVLVDWHSACAFARWRAARDRLPFRLPDELEREKAARGADARFFPWGNHFDATWACVVDSHAGNATRVSVDRFPLDESPYGARGLAGNVAEWCANVWTHEGPDVRGGPLRSAPAAPDDPELRAVRGGSWTQLAELSRSAARFASRPGRRWTTTGLRLVRSLSGG